MPGWAAAAVRPVRPSRCIIALFGMYWDIALHIDDGRDAGPLANPAHYLILVGLFGIFAAGVLAVSLPRRRPAAPQCDRARLVRAGRRPADGPCGAFALAGFPLDDMWHRLFGQDVTLWGPTHLMLIGGAGMTLLGQACCCRRERRARPRRRPRAASGSRARRLARRCGRPADRPVDLPGRVRLRRAPVPAVFQPVLIAFAAGFALVAARMWIGRGGALFAALFFLPSAAGSRCWSAPCSARPRRPWRSTSPRRS